MRKQFRKKDNKMCLSSIDPSTTNRFQFSPPDKNSEASEELITQFSLIEEKQLNQSFVTEESDNTQSNFGMAKSGVSQSILLNSEQKSELQIKSDIQLVRRKTEGFIERNKVINQPLINYKEKINILLPQTKFKAKFTQLIQNNINFVTKNSTQKLIILFRSLEINHPFAQDENSMNKSFFNCSRLMDLWILEFQSHKRLIFSFDFLFSHSGLILSLLFYYAHFSNQSTNPLNSLAEEIQLQKKQSSAKKNILKILFEYIWYRSRDLRTKYFIIRLLEGFYQYIQQQQAGDSVIIHYCMKSKELLKHNLKIQCLVRQQVQQGKQCASDHLQQMCINYEQKDKLIKDSVNDIGQLFNLVILRNFVNCSLSLFYQMNEHQSAKKNIAKKSTLLTCWLLSILLNKCKINGNIALDYLQRYFQLCKVFIQKRNLECLQLFASLILIVKQYMSQLWFKFVEKRKIINPEQELDAVFKFLNSTKLVVNPKDNQVILFEYVRIIRLVEIVKERFKEKGFLSLLFHQDIQECARRIIHYRKLAELKLMNQNKNNKTIRMNMNYRFLSFYLYEMLEAKIRSPEDQFEKLKEQMLRVDKKITYSFQFF